MNNTSPVFGAQKLKLNRICKGDRTLPIKIEILSFELNNTDKVYGEVITTVGQFEDKK